jgi:hypothetical protein
MLSFQNLISLPRFAHARSPASAAIITISPPRALMACGQRFRLARGYTFGIIAFWVRDLTLSSDQRQHGIGSFFRGDRVHAAKIQWAFAKKARAAFDLMAKNRALRRTGTCQAWFR